MSSFLLSSLSLSYRSPYPVILSLLSKINYSTFFSRHYAPAANNQGTRFESFFRKKRSSLSASLARSSRWVFVKTGKRSWKGGPRTKLKPFASSNWFYKRRMNWKKIICFKWNINRTKLYHTCRQKDINRNIFQ